MAKQIKRSDIVEKDIFKNLIDSANDSIDKLQQMNEQFKTMAITIKKSMSSTKFATTKELNEFIKSTKTATQLSKEQAKVLQELEKVEQQKARTETELLKVQDQLIRSQRVKMTDDEKQAKIDQRKTKQIEDENNAYKKLEKSTRELKNESKRLGAEMLQLEREGKGTTKAYFDLENEFKRVTRSAQQGDQALKKLDSTVGDNFRNVGNYESAVNKLGKGLGMLGLAFGIGDVIQNAGKTLIDFDQSIADLVSITGAGGKDLEYFKEQSILLGKEVEGGAKNVIEAYKLIGSAKPELLANAEGLNAVTESAIKLSKASGMDLPASATALTDALNQFGAPAEDAGKFINVLANGALFGAAEIPQVTEALLKFGAVAKSSNVSIEESTALIEMLASKGLKGAEAGTALRNVMLKLSAPDALPKEAKEMLSGLGIDMKKLADTSVPFADRLKELSPILKNETAQIKVFGLENVVSAKNLLNNIDGIKELTQQMETKGTVDQQATDRTKTLNQALIQLKGAWDEVVLGFASGTGASSILVETLSFIARNLGTILNVATKLALGYGLLIATKKAMIVINKLEGKSLGDIFGYLKKAITGTNDLNDAQQGASRGAKALGTAMKTIGFAIAIELAIELVKALYDIASGASQARDDMARLEQASERAMKSATANIKKIQATQKEADEKARNAKTGGTIDQIELDKKLLSNSKKTNEQLKGNIKSVSDRHKQASDDLQRLQKAELKATILKNKEGSLTALQNLTKEIAERNKIGGNASWVTFFTGEADMATVQDVSAQLKANIKAQEVKVKEYKEALVENTFEVNSNSAEVQSNSKTINENTKTKTKNVNTTKDLNTEFKDINEVISEQAELINELNNIYQEREIAVVTDEIKAEYDKQLKLAETTGAYNVDILEENIRKEKELKILQAEENLKFKIDALQKELEALIEAKKKELEVEKLSLLSQKDLTPEAKKKIEDNYAEKQKELDAELLKSKADTETKKVIATEEAKDEIVKINKEANDQIIEYNDNLTNAIKKHFEDEKDETAKTNKDIVDKEKQKYKDIDALVKASADYFIKLSNEKIKAIDGEIDALGKQKQFLEQLAVNGNITAEKSLAINEKLTAEANLKKQKELKKQEKIKLAESVFTSYMSNVEKGEGNAIVKTISDISVLTAFINSLPTFYSGTDRTIAESLGSPNMSGKDGYIVRVDGSEKVLNPELSRMTGNMTTYEIAKLSEDKIRGRLMSKNNSVNILTADPHTEVLAKKFDELNSTIQNKPEINIEVGEIINGVMHIIESSKIKNNTVRNISRFS